MACKNQLSDDLIYLSRVIKQIRLAVKVFELAAKSARKREFIDESDLVIPWSQLLPLMASRAPILVILLKPLKLRFYLVPVNPLRPLTNRHESPEILSASLCHFFRIEKTLWGDHLQTRGVG
jgi:hypothetical protein